jgi:hypothetical protein
MIEHSPKELNVSDCLETKRKIERNSPEGGNSYVMCGELKKKNESIS